MLKTKYFKDFFVPSQLTQSPASTQSLNLVTRVSLVSAPSATVIYLFVDNSIDTGEMMIMGMRMMMDR